MPDVGNTLVISGNPSILGLNDGITKLNQEIAPEFVPDQPYKAGQLVSHNGYFYVFTDDFAGGTWEQALPCLMDTTVATQIELMPNKIVQTVESMRYTRTFIQETDPTLDPENDVHLGDYWIQIPGTKKWNDLKDTRWKGLANKGLGQLMDMETIYCWDGTAWKRVYDTSLVYTAYSRITQTEDMIKSEVYRANGAEGVLFTTIEQTASEIKLYAEQYTDEHAYGIKSGITIEAAGITVSGSQYIIIESGGYFRVKTGNFGIVTDASDNEYVLWSGGATGSESLFSVKKNGDIKATSGEIGGFMITDHRLSSGSGSNYVRLDSDASGTYAIVCGASTAASAPFSVTRAGALKATSGSIGGFDITSKYLSGGSGTNYVRLDSDASHTYAIVCGSETAADAPFSVTKAGAVKATSGNIGGFTVNAYDLHAGSGSTYVELNSDASENYALWIGNNAGASAPFSVSRNGAIKSTSGSIGGFNINETRLSSGSGSNYVRLDSKPSNTYAIVCGAESESEAPFRVARDGKVYLTKLMVIDENSQEREVNLRNYGLWKLNYNTVRAYTDSSITLSNGAVINFNTPTDLANAYIEGWNACLASCGIEGGGTVYTGTVSEDGYDPALDVWFLVVRDYTAHTLEAQTPITPEEPESD